MKRLLIFFPFLLLVAVSSPAQDLRYKANGPFFNEEYCPAILYSAESHVYNGLKIKLNLYTGDVRFVKDNSDEIELTIMFTVRKIVFGNCPGTEGVVFKSGFPPAGPGLTKNTLYQVLDSGKISLLKYIRIAPTNDQPHSDYGNAEVIYERIESYFLFSPQTGFRKIARSKDGILKALEDKRAAVEEFINTNNLKCRTDEDLVKVVKGYNGWE